MTDASRRALVARALGMLQADGGGPDPLSAAPANAAPVVAAATAAAAANAPSPATQTAAALVPMRCVECGDDVLPHAHSHVVQRCRHPLHATCFARAVALGRAACVACPLPDADLVGALSAGGYVVDTGNDALVRSNAMRVLDVHVNQAGVPARARARTRAPTS